MIDEIERLGTEQLLRSRGARTLDFIGFDARALVVSLNPKADLVVVSRTFDNGPDDQIVELLESVAQTVPGVPLLIVCGTYARSSTQLALDRVPNPGEVIVRASRLDSNAILEAARRLLVLTPNQDSKSSPSDDPECLLATTRGIGQLSTREFQVLGQVATGLSNAQIAKKLDLRVRTVNNHLGSVFLKLGMNGNSETNARVCATLAYCAHNGILAGMPAIGIHEGRLRKTPAAQK